MNLQLQALQHRTRRHFLRESTAGIGGMALASLLARESAAAPQVNPLVPKSPHYQPRVKRVIYLHMSGAPPHLDMFDYKPELVKLSGQDAPESFIKGRRVAFTSGTPKLLGTPRT
jgi:hypothetical protein